MARYRAGLALAALCAAAALAACAATAPAPPPALALTPAVAALSADQRAALAAAATTIPAAQFCSFMDGLGGLRCGVLDIIQGMLLAYKFTCANTAATGTFNQVEPPPKSTTGAPIPAPLADLRPLPADVPAATVAAEGGTLNWLYRVVNNLSAFSQCSPENGGAASFLVPSGWSLVSLIKLSQGRRATPAALPFATVLASAATGQVVVGLRGTNTQSEWGRDFAYSQTTKTTVRYKSPNGRRRRTKLTGAVHFGFAQIYSEIAPAILEAVLSEVVKSKATSVTVAGHSLGAGVGQLLALALQNALASDPATSGLGVKVGAALFAAPNAGDAAFVAAFNRAVSARRIALNTDLVPQVPCTPKMFTCSAASVPTNKPGNKADWPYEPVGGTLKFTGADMPVQADLWSKLQNVPLDTAAAPFLFATHICAYLCYTSQFTGDTNNQCLLSNASPTPPGSFCPGFPTSEPLF